MAVESQQAGIPYLNQRRISHNNTHHRPTTSTVPGAIIISCLDVRTRKKVKSFYTSQDQIRQLHKSTQIQTYARIQFPHSISCFTRQLCQESGILRGECGIRQCGSNGDSVVVDNHDAQDALVRLQTFQSFFDFGLRELK